MAWIYLDLISLNKQGNWEFSDIFPVTTQAIKFTESMVIQGTPIPPENSTIRALLSLAQFNDLGLTELTEAKLIYPSNYQIIYPVPLHPFTNPRIALRILGTFYRKYEPQWNFNIYYWEGETNGIGSGNGSIDQGIGGGNANPNLV